MSDVESPVSEHQALAPRRSATGRTPPGYRVLHLIVPEPTFNHVKAQSYLSGMRFPDYMARFLNEAWPYNDNLLPSDQVDAQAHRKVNDEYGQTGPVQRACHKPRRQTKPVEAPEVTR